MRFLSLLIVLLASCCGVPNKTAEPIVKTLPTEFTVTINLGKAYAREETLAKSPIAQGYKTELRRRLDFVFQRLLTADSAISQVQMTLAQSLIDKANKDMDSIEVWINERKTVKSDPNSGRLYTSSLAWDALGDIGQCFGPVGIYLQGSCPR